MNLDFYSLVGAFVLLIAGILELAVAQRIIYPLLRWRYERAKITQTQGFDPNRIMMAVRVQSLVIMPVIGLFLGGRIRALVG